jgi:hypothetical protein
MTEQADVEQSDLIITAGSGGLALRSLGGSIEVREGRSVADPTTSANVGTGILVAGSGDILIEAQSAGASISLLGDVRSDAGRIAIRAADRLNIGDSSASGVEVSPGAALGITLDLLADQRIEIHSAATLQGAGSGQSVALPQVRFAPLSVGRTIDVGGTAQDPSTLKVIAPNGFDRAILGFDGLVFGGPDRSGLIRLGGAPVLAFAGRVEFSGSVDLSSSTIVQSRELSFAGGPGSVQANSATPFVLQPLSKADPIQIGGTATAAGSGRYVISDAILSAIGSAGGRVIVGYDASHGEGGRGPVTISGQVDLASPLTVYGQTLLMSAGSRLSANDLQLRLSGDAWISEVRADRSVALHSSGGFIRSIDADLLNVSTRAGGAVPMLAVTGRGALVGTAEPSLSALAAVVNVTVPTGGTDRIQLADGTSRYLGFDARGNRYLMLEVSGPGAHDNPAMRDSAGDAWQFSQSGGASTHHRTAFSAPSLLSVLLAEVSLPFLQGAAPTTPGPVLKQLNTDTRQYLQTLGGGGASAALRQPSTGLDSRDDDRLLDTLFDPLDAAAAVDPAQLENAWLLGSDERLPLATGIALNISDRFQLWTDHDELTL